MDFFNKPERGAISSAFSCYDKPFAEDNVIPFAPSGIA